MKTNGTEDPEIKAHSYSHLIVDKGNKDALEKKTASLANGAEKPGYLHEEH
jgi:hypothetical protein